MRRNDVASTSFRRRVPIRFLINQCQIITFLILKYDIIENSKIELRGIVLPVQMGGLLGGGAKGYVGPPSQIIGGGLAPPGPPLPTPMFSYIMKTNYDIIAVETAFDSALSDKCSDVLIYFCQEHFYPFLHTADLQWLEHR